MKTVDERTQRRRERHHKALAALAQTVGCETDGLTLWRQLRRLEVKVYAACEEYSNNANYGAERWNNAKDEAKAELARIFGGNIPAGVYVNGDPRGHMLKLDCDEATVPEGMQRDWGNNGILACEINEED